MTKGQFSVAMVCITALLITVKVMPNDGGVFPESIDKARELCKDHGGVKQLTIADYANLKTVFNRVNVTCKNNTRITTLLEKENK